MGKKISEMGLEELWQLFPIYLTEHDRDGYTDSKTAFVKEYTQKAKIEFEDRYAITERYTNRFSLLWR